MDTLCILSSDFIYLISFFEKIVLFWVNKTAYLFPKLVNIQMDYWYIIGILNIHWTVLTNVAWENNTVRPHLCNGAGVFELLNISNGTRYKQWAASVHVTACLTAHVLRKEGVMKL